MNKKNIVGIIWLVVIVVIVGFLWKRSYVPTSLYSNNEFGVSWKYPSAYKLIENEAKDEDGIKSYILRFNASQKGEVLIVPSVRTIADSIKEREFYEKMLFDNNKELKNSHVKIGAYEGFKSTATLDHIFYTLYRPRTATTTLILRTEINASSTEGVALEKDLLSMMNSLKIVH